MLVPPHEWFALHGYKATPGHEQLRRTVFLCAEQPETSFFLDNALLAPYAGAVFDINPGSLEEFAATGIDGVRRFQLGWTRTWSTIGHADLERERAAEGRDVDVLHLGVHSDRRARAIGATGASSPGGQTQFLLAPSALPERQAPRELRHR